MAKLVECDRCGATEKILPPGPSDNSCRPIGLVPKNPDLPTGWLRIPSLFLSVPNPLGAGAVLDGGEFCGSCVRALREWRRPIPKAGSAD